MLLQKKKQFPLYFRWQVHTSFSILTTLKRKFTLVNDKFLQQRNFCGFLFFSLLLFVYLSIYIGYRVQSRNLCASCISLDIDDCYPSPCENNGTCIDGVNNYTCACVPGFEGKNCTISKLLNKSFKQTLNSSVISYIF